MRLAAAAAPLAVAVLLPAAAHAQTGGSWDGWQTGGSWDSDRSQAPSDLPSVAPTTVHGCPRSMSKIKIEVRRFVGDARPRATTASAVDAPSAMASSGKEGGFGHCLVRRALGHGLVRKGRRMSLWFLSGRRH